MTNYIQQNVAIGHPLHPGQPTQSGVPISRVALAYPMNKVSWVKDTPHLRSPRASGVRSRSSLESFLGTII